MSKPAKDTLLETPSNRLCDDNLVDTASRIGDALAFVTQAAVKCDLDGYSGSEMNGLAFVLIGISDAQSHLIDRLKVVQS